MKKLIIIFWILLLSTTYVSNAQNSITLSKGEPIYMNFTSSFDAGLPKKIITDNSQWLNYTTLVHPSDPTISISIELVSGSIPEGMELQVEASPYIGMSRGKPGRASKKITVSHMPRILIDNIGTCYTGSGRNEGHRLTFSFVITDYSKIQSGINSIYLQYTITQ